jgi:hypothetical protein
VIENTGETQTRGMVFILAAFFPVSERHYQISAYVLDIEGSIVIGEAAPSKSVFLYFMPVCPAH